MWLSSSEAYYPTNTIQSCIYHQRLHGHDPAAVSTRNMTILAQPMAGPCMSMYLSAVCNQFLQNQIRIIRIATCNPIQLFWWKTFVQLELALCDRYFRYVYVHAHIYMYIYCICKICIGRTFPFLGSLLFKLAKLFALRDPHEPSAALLEGWKHNEKRTDFLLLCNHTSWQSGQHPQYYCISLQ